MIYVQFIRFLLPLVFTVVVQEMGGQVLNGGMTRMPQSTETLASYGLAWGLITFLTSPLLQARQLGLVLIDSQQALRKVRLIVLASALALSAVLAVLAITPVGVWVIEDLHDLAPSLGAVARVALAWLIPVPVLRGLLRFHQGMLIRARRTGVVSAATMSSIGVSIASTFVLLRAPFVRAQPIVLPLSVTYAGLAVELGVVLWGYRRHVWGVLDEHGRALSYRYIIRFFWPLALTMAVQGFSRPLINLFVSRGAGGADALAVLTVVYTLGHLPYGWLNEIRSLPAAFKDEENALLHVRRFALGCGLAVFLLMVALFWTPVRDYILRTWIGVDEAMASGARVPLVLFAFFPLAVMVRATLHGVALIEHRTAALTPSGPARIGAILVVLVILSFTEVHGATRAVAALLSGFTLETVAVWLGVRGTWSTERTRQS
jgi:progressive ankylosis protein